MRISSLLLFLLALCSHANARIGETESECNARYGPPKRGASIVPGCQTNEYDYHGFKIKIAFPGPNNPAIKMIFTKSPILVLKEDEVAAILNANTKEGMQWKRVASELGATKQSDPFTRVAAAYIASSVGARSWVRNDGVTAELEVTKTVVTLESPESVVRKKRAKDEEEASRKAAIPNF